MDDERHRLPISVRGEGDGRASAMLYRVADQVRHDLGEPVGIPFAAQVPGWPQIARRRQVGRHGSRSLPPRTPPEDRRASVQRNGSPQPGAGQIQEIADHPLHALRAVHDARHDAAAPLRIVLGHGQERGARR